MRNFIFILLCLFLSVFVFGQAPMRSPLAFMPLPAQQNANNPASWGNYDGYIAIPLVSGLSAGLQSDFLSYDRFIKRDVFDSLHLDFSKLIHGLKLKNTLQIEAGLDIINFGFKAADRHYLSFGVSVNMESHALLTKNLMSFLLRGPGASLGENDLSGNHFEFNMYSSIYGHWAYQINEQWSFGIRLKYLNGLYNFRTKKMKAAIGIMNYDPEDPSYDTTMSPYYYLLSGDMKFETNLPGKKFDSPLALFQNHGFAMDVGFEYKPRKDVRLSFAVKDLGAIFYKKNARAYITKNAGVPYTFEGLRDIVINIGEQAPAFDSLIKDVIGGVIDTLGIRTESDDYKYTYVLPTKFMLGLSYDLKEVHRLGLLFKGRLYPSFLSYDFVMAYTYTMSRNFSVSVSNTISNNSFFNLGIGIAGNLGPVQLFLTVDRLNSFKVISMQSAAVQLGINILLNKKDLYTSY